MVTAQDVQDAIEAQYFFTADTAFARFPDPEHRLPLRMLTICALLLKNGTTVLGKSHCEGLEGFDPNIEQQNALEDAKREAWPLLSYCLKQQLYDRRLALSEPTQEGE